LNIAWSKTEFVIAVADVRCWSSFGTSALSGKVSGPSWLFWAERADVEIIPAVSATTRTSDREGRLICPPLLINKIAAEKLPDKIESPQGETILAQHVSAG
jgi:hypothetical protein